MSKARNGAVSTFTIYDGEVFWFWHELVFVTKDHDGKIPIIRRANSPVEHSQILLLAKFTTLGFL